LTNRTPPRLSKEKKNSSTNSIQHPHETGYDGDLTMSVLMVDDNEVTIEDLLLYDADFPVGYVNMQHPDDGVVAEQEIAPVLIRHDALITIDFFCVFRSNFKITCS
jgi:hypothetical protein